MIPAPNNMSCSLLSWKDDKKAPTFLYDTLASAESDVDSSSMATEKNIGEGVIAAVKDSISTNYPKFGGPSDEAVLQLFKQQPSVARTVRYVYLHL